MTLITGLICEGYVSLRIKLKKMEVWLIVMLRSRTCQKTCETFFFFFFKGEDASSTALQLQLHVHCCLKVLLKRVTKSWRCGFQEIKHTCLLFMFNVFFNHYHYYYYYVLLIMR